MPKTVSSSEAKSRFGELLKWTKETNDTVIVKLYGEPAAVLVSYKEYEESQRQRKRALKQQALAALEAMRQEARRQNPGLSAEDAYRIAGFSEEVIQETLQRDRESAEG